MFFRRDGEQEEDNNASESDRMKARQLEMLQPDLLETYPKVR